MGYVNPVSTYARHLAHALSRDGAKPTGSAIPAHEAPEAEQALLL